MDLDTVISNLERTIAGKQAYLDSVPEQHGAGLVANVVTEFLSLNLVELRRILADVRQVKEG